MLFRRLRLSLSIRGGALLKSDFHTHTCCSPDSASPVDQVIGAAVSRGLDAVAITDHVETDSGKVAFASPSCRTYREYQEAISHARLKFDGRITTLMGVEVSYSRESEPQIREFLRRYDFDMVIGSIHDSPPVNWWDSHAGVTLERQPELGLQALTWYFDQLEGAAASGLFDVIAHVDVYERYFPGKWPNVFEEDSLAPLVENAVKAIAEHSRMEINLAMLNQRGELAWSALPFLRMYREMGGRPPAVGSDAHRLNWVGLRVEEGEVLARKADFNGVATWEDVVNTRKS